MNVEIVRAPEMGETLRQHVMTWLVEEFGDYANIYAWAVADWHVLAWDDKQLVGHVDITERTVQVNGQAVRLGGIGGVVTLPEYRQRGIATATLQQAARFLKDELAVPFGLLICDPALASFYRKLGWQEVSGPLVFNQPAPSGAGQEHQTSDGQIHQATLEGAILILPCGEASWPDGLIDLCGLPW